MFHVKGNGPGSMHAPGIFPGLCDDWLTLREPCHREPEPKGPPLPPTRWPRQDGAQSPKSHERIVIFTS